MFAVTLGHLVISNNTAALLALTSIAFLSSFIFISQTNDMVGALQSLLPKRGKGPLPGPNESTAAGSRLEKAK
tara:strand:- start:2163 stop:2381 length:219 start_codon:yes stop_codon:yes gene_type:complete